VNRAEKRELAGELRQVFDTSSIVIVSHNRGLTVSAVNTLRNKVRSIDNSKYKVAKNRLVKIALEGREWNEFSDLFKGPTTIAYSSDVVAISKTLVEFAKDNEKLEILGGVMDGKYIDKKTIDTLASLPSLDALRGKLLGLLNAPATKVAGVLQAPAGQLARVLNAYATK
jgi:large subunit ribosomal protein L10